MTKNIRMMYVLSLACWFLLFGLICGYIVLAHSDNELPRSIKLLTVAGPLLLVFKGLLNGSPKSHLFAAVLSLVYFCIGISNYLDPASRLYAGLQIIFSSGLFITGVLYARWAGKAEKTAVGESTQATRQG